MKDLVNRVLPYLHYIILAYCGYGLYTQYEAHTEAVAQIDAKLPPIETNLTQTKRKLREIDEFKKKAEEYKLRVQEVAKNIEIVQSQLPAETNDSQILTFFNTEMSALNIRQPNITPGLETPGPFFIARDYSLKAKGTFLQFLIFLERINSADRIYNVKSFKLVNNAKSQKSRFQVIEADTIIQAYKFNPDAFKIDPPKVEKPAGEVK
jgi:Tfp pilus assembly protein PilO